MLRHLPAQPPNVGTDLIVSAHTGREPARITAGSPSGYNSGRRLEKHGDLAENPANSAGLISWRSYSASVCRQRQFRSVARSLVHAHLAAAGQSAAAHRGLTVLRYLSHSGGQGSTDSSGPASPNETENYGSHNGGIIF